jgi:hypothetical protein
VETGPARARRELITVTAAMPLWRADPVGEKLTDVLAPVNNEETQRDHV